jgi:hypothetical protein
MRRVVMAFARQRYLVIQTVRANILRIFAALQIAITSVVSLAPFLALVLR